MTGVGFPNRSTLVVQFASGGLIEPGPAGVRVNSPRVERLSEGVLIVTEQETFLQGISPQMPVGIGEVGLAAGPSVVVPHMGWGCSCPGFYTESFARHSGYVCNCDNLQIFAAVFELSEVNSTVPGINKQLHQEEVSFSG